MGYDGLTGRFLVAMCLAVMSLGAGAQTIGGTQWRPIEFKLVALHTHSHPMRVRLAATFRGPRGAVYHVPGFWDGGNRWKVRFAPVSSGTWTYDIASADGDPGLRAEGRFDVKPARGRNPLFRHGGFLKASGDNRYLTYSDGTPFFWLGDTWWFCPSSLCPIDGSSAHGSGSMFKTLVDVRAHQGYTVFQTALLGPESPVLVRGGPDAWNEKQIRYWQRFDRYVTYANHAGLIPVIGIGFHHSLDRVHERQLEELWRYVVARYGAYPVTWLVVGEYNLGNDPRRVYKALRVGAYIKKIDPYNRAMTIHPCNYKCDHHQAWDQSWEDFIMLHGGHFKPPPPARVYLDAYWHEPHKPVLEGECDYEGVHGMTARDVRRAAYRAIQSGSFGYTYGAQGLWYPTQDRNDRRFSRFGKPVVWWKALEKPGGREMGYLRRLYESVKWWRLEPKPDATFTARQLNENRRVLVKADGDRTFVVYFPGGPGGGVGVGLFGTDPKASYSAEWFDPRTGEFIKSEAPLTRDRRMLFLPQRPDLQDWVLVLRKQGLAH